MAVPSGAEAIECWFSRSDGRFDICVTSGCSQEISLKGGELSSSVDLAEGLLLLFLTWCYCSEQKSVWLNLLEGVVPVGRIGSQLLCCTGIRMKQMPCGTSWPFLLP